MADHTPTDIPDHLVARAVRAALLEDIGPGDLTSDALVPPDRISRARLEAGEPLTVAGLSAARLAFLQLDPKTRFPGGVGDGETLAAGDSLLEVEATTRAILSAERTALNFVGRLSGIATLTRRCVSAVEGTQALIYDTRKTTPGWRPLEREAVRLGGGRNHRFGLFDGVLIKDNHLVLAGDAAESVRLARKHHGPSVMVEVELEELTQLEEVFGAGCDIVLLDNMPPDLLQEAVRRRDAWSSTHARQRVLLEASGGITVANVRTYAETGVDRISLGSLTHSAPSSNIHLEMEI